MIYRGTPQPFSGIHELFPFWMLKKIFDYNKVPLTPTNIFEIPAKLSLDRQITELKFLWSIESKKEAPDLFCIIKQILKKEFYYAMILGSISHTFNSCSCISIYFIYYYLNYDYSISQGILIAIITSLCIIISTISRRAAILKIDYTKIKLSTVLISLIQDKLLKIDLYFTTNSEETSKIVNSLSTDLEIISLLDTSLEFLGALPKIIISISILLWIIGPIGLIGFGISLFHVPIILIISTFMIKNKEKSEAFTQLRIGKMKNFIESIQILKMFVWEKPFIKRINEERFKEISYLKKFDMIRAALQSITLAGVCLSIFVTSIINRYYGNSLNLGEILLVINSICTLQFFLPFTSIVALSVIIMIKQAIKKVETVLILKEFKNKIAHDIELKSESHHINSVINHGQEEPLVKTSDNLDINQLILRLLRINFKIQTGELLMIVGKVGSGKSRLF